MSLKEIRHKLKNLSNPEIAKSAREIFLSDLMDDRLDSDQFFGVTVSNIRNLAHHQQQADLSDLKVMLNSEWHEERMMALLIMSKRFGKSSTQEQKSIFDLYIQHTHKINSWDLIDISAAPIIGAWLHPRSRNILHQLAKSGSVWEKRIAVVSTFYFIKKDHYSETFKLCELLFHEEQELIHKACGWMLQEIGKRDLRELINFLKRFHGRVPKVMLNAAIKGLPEHLEETILTGDY